MAEQQQGAAEKAPVEKVKLTVSGVLADLSNGLDRVAIRQKYGLSATDVKRLFEHEKLKGARVKVAPKFELEDDTEDAPVKAPKVVTAPKAKAPAAAPVTASAAAVNEALAQDDDVEEDDEEVVEANDAIPSGQVNEVVTADDTAEPAATEKTGLW